LSSAGRHCRYPDVERHAGPFRAARLLGVEHIAGEVETAFERAVDAHVEPGLDRAHANCIDTA